MIIFSKRFGICLIFLFIFSLITGCKDNNKNKNFIQVKSEYNRFLKENDLEEKAEYVLSIGAKNDKQN